MGNKVAARNPKYQAGVDFYQKRPWRQLYLRAPEGARRYYEITFYRGVVFYGGVPANHDTEEEKRDLINVYRTLTNEDWDYIIEHTHWGMAKWGLNQAREKYGRKERWSMVGKKYFYENMRV